MGIKRPAQKTRARQLESQRKSSDRKLVKVTVSLRPKQVLAIEQMQVDYRAETDNKITKTDLLQQAVDLLIREKLGESRLR